MIIHIDFRFYIFIINYIQIDNDTITICMQNPSSRFCYETCSDNKINIIKRINKKYIFVINLLSLVYTTSEENIINTLPYPNFYIDINLNVFKFFLLPYSNKHQFNILSCGQHFLTTECKANSLKTLYKNALDELIYLKNKCNISFKRIHGTTSKKYKSYYLPYYFNHTSRRGHFIHETFIFNAINNYNELKDCLV